MVSVSIASVSTVSPGVLVASSSGAFSSFCVFSKEIRGDTPLLRKRVDGGSKDKRRLRNKFDGAGVKELEYLRLSFSIVVLGPWVVSEVC